jgi:hypothetical protein
MCATATLASRAVHVKSTADAMAMGCARQMVPVRAMLAGGWDQMGASLSAAAVLQVLAALHQGSVAVCLAARGAPATMAAASAGQVSFVFSNVLP